MSQLTAAFNQSRRKLSTRAAKPQGNIILKAKEFTDSTVKGEVLTGPSAGSEIEVRVPNNGGKSVGVKEFTKEGHKSFVDVEKGGTLRIEKVREGEKGIYDARWIRTFNGVPQAEHDVIYDAVANLRILPGKDRDGHSQIIMNVLSPEKEQTATNLDGLRDALAAAFEQANGAYVFFVESGQAVSIPLGRGGAMVDGVYVPNDPVEQAKTIIEEFGDLLPAVEKALSESPVSVVPSRQLRVGKTTADMVTDAIEEAAEAGASPRISTIDPDKFKILSTGVRVQYSLGDTSEGNTLPKDAADRLKERFMEVASEEAKADFHKSGWRGVSNDDMRRFFEATDVSITAHTETGWSRQSVLLKGGVAIKSFGQDSAVPYPNVAACKDAIQTFRNEVRDAILAVVEAPVKKVEVQTPKEEVTATVNLAAAAPGAADIDDLDALLDDVQDADMGA
jgi:hypothetical protein